MLKSRLATHRGALLIVGLVCVLALLPACTKEDVQPQFVARVGTETLDQHQLTDRLAATPVGRDTAAVVRQMVDQWVVNALLEQEARRLSLYDDPEVSRLLAENEQSVLVSAYVNRLYEENPVEPSLDEIERFFELNRDRLRLRQAFVRVRYLQHPERDTVLAARSALQRAMRGPDVDSLWIEITKRYSADADGSLALADNHFAESRLFTSLPGVRDVLSRLGERQVSRVIAEGDRYHLVQLVDRVEEGSIPEMHWVEDEIVRQLILQGRKQTFARAVQNLRNMATARNDLEVRIPDSLGSR